MQNQPSGPKGPITFVNDPDKEETVGISQLIPGQKESKFIRWLLPDEEVTLQAAIGDVFDFEIKGTSDFTLPPYTVEQFNQKYQFEIGMRWKDARTKYARTTNADANRFSYDIFHLNPLYIDQAMAEGGGKQQQIFESLEEDDRDWKVYDGDVALKKTFDLKVVDRGEGKTETKMYYGSQAFEKGFSANVGVSGGVPVATGSLSVGFNKMTKDESAQGEVFTYSRKADTAYIIDLVPKQAKLHRHFKEEVLKLEVPATVPVDLAQAKKQDGFAAYRNFITQWGTHYPTRVHYGGYIVAYKRNTLEEVASEDGWGVTVKAGVSAPVGPASVGVEGEFGYSEKQKYADKNSTEKMGYFHVGGRGDDKSWNVGDQVQPIQIQLARLDELLTPIYFKDQTPANDLAGRRAMLKFALEEYIGSKTDAGQALRPKVFKIVADNWRIIKGANDDKEFDLYGNIKIFSDNKDLSLWEKGKDDDEKVAKGRTIYFPKGSELTKVVYPSRGAFYLSQHQFILNALLAWDNPYVGGPQHCIGFAWKSITLDQVNMDLNQSLQIQFRKGQYRCDELDIPGATPAELEKLRKIYRDNFYLDGDWEIDVVTKVYEVEFSEMGFDGL